MPSSGAPSGNPGIQPMSPALLHCRRALYRLSHHEKSTDGLELDVGVWGHANEILQVLNALLQ